MNALESLEKRIARLRAKRLTSELFVWPRKPAFVREPSKSEQENAKRKRDIFKCVHGKHYFTPCKHCRRTNADATAWEAFLLKKQKVS